MLQASRSDLQAIMNEVEVVNADGRIEEIVVGKHDGSKKYADLGMREEMNAKLHADKLASTGTRPKELKPLPPELPTEPFEILQANTCWECSALPGFASGHFASVHCRPGEFDGDMDGDSITRWDWKETPGNEDEGGACETGRCVLKELPGNSQWEEDKPPWANLVTSCSNNFLQRLEEWNRDRRYDVITLQEMGNPGRAGMSHIGRPEATLPAGFKDQQMDPKVYQYLKNNILLDYEVFGMVIVKKNIVTQATYWKKSMGVPTIAVGIDTWFERPVSALFFADKKRLVINYHGVHFRLQLIKEDGRQQFGPLMPEVLAAKPLEKRDSEFSVEQFPTDKLQILFGKWLERMIIEGLKKCKDFGLNDEQVFCTGTGKGMAFKQRVLGNQQSFADWNIYIAGDINDELNEISEFQIFKLRVKAGARMRTCCSDRDDDFKMFEFQKTNKYVGYEVISPLYKNQGMTVANADYWFNSCKYFDTLEKMQEHLDSPMNPMKLPGARKITKANPDAIVESGYPFASDIILSNVKGANMEYAPGWVQDMRAMISDHDIVYRSFAEPVVEA